MNEVQEFETIEQQSDHLVEPLGHALMIDSVVVDPKLLDEQHEQPEPTWVFDIPYQIAKDSPEYSAVQERLESAEPSDTPLLNFRDLDMMPLGVYNVDNIELGHYLVWIIMNSNGDRLTVYGGDRSSVDNEFRGIAQACGYVTTPDGEILMHPTPKTFQRNIAENFGLAVRIINDGYGKLSGHQYLGAFAVGEYPAASDATNEYWTHDSRPDDHIGAILAERLGGGPEGSILMGLLARAAQRGYNSPSDRQRSRTIWAIDRYTNELSGLTRKSGYDFTNSKKFNKARKILGISKKEQETILANIARGVSH